MYVAHQSGMAGGWHYIHNGYRIQSDSYDQLVIDVQDYLLSHNIPASDIEKSIIEFICSVSPRTCRKSPSASKSSKNLANTYRAAASGNPMMDRVSHWASEILKKPEAKTLVSPHDADERAAICASCQFNVPWKNGCGKCVNNAERMLHVIRQARKNRHDSKLNACSANGYCVKTAIWLNKSIVHLSESAPSSCWVRQ